MLGYRGGDVLWIYLSLNCEKGIIKNDIKDSLALARGSVKRTGYENEETETFCYRRNERKS